MGRRGSVRHRARVMDIHDVAVPHRDDGRLAGDLVRGVVLRLHARLRHSLLSVHESPRACHPHRDRCGQRLHLQQDVGPRQAREERRHSREDRLGHDQARHAVDLCDEPNDGRRVLRQLRESHHGARVLRAVRRDYRHCQLLYRDHVDSGGAGRLREVVIRLLPVLPDRVLR